jgi:hypothetical protein
MCWIWLNGKKGQTDNTTDDKTLHSNVKTEQHELYKGTMEGQTAPASLMQQVVFNS